GAVFLGNLEATGAVRGVSLNVPGKETHCRVVKRPTIMLGKTRYEWWIDLGGLRFQSDGQTGNGNLPWPLVHHAPAPVGEGLGPGQHRRIAHRVTRVATGGTEVEDHVHVAIPGIFFLREVFQDVALDFVDRAMRPDMA